MLRISVVSKSWFRASCSIAKARVASGTKVRCDIGFGLVLQMCPMHVGQAIAASEWTVRLMPICHTDICYGTIYADVGARCGLLHHTMTFGDTVFLPLWQRTLAPLFSIAVCCYQQHHVPLYAAGWCQCWSHHL